MFEVFRRVASGESSCPCRHGGWNLQCCPSFEPRLAKAVALAGPSGSDPQLLLRECSVALQRLEDVCPNFCRRNGTKRPASPSENGEWAALRKRVKRILSGGDDGRPLSRKGGYSVTVADLKTVLGHNWLNDAVIDVYMQLVVDGDPGTYAFSTHFYSVLRSRGYEAVRRWTENVDLFSYERVLVPVHDQDHWSLVALDVRAGRLHFYDSMGRKNAECCRCLVHYLRRERREKGAGGPHAWEVHFVRGIPVQNNTYDCGAFVCLYAERLVRGGPFNFTGKDLPRLRYRIAHEILKGQLL